MRISVIEGDSGFRLWQDMSKATVFLDGQQVYYVLTADEMLGFVLVQDRNEWGMLQFDSDDNILTKKLRGRVEITFE